MGWPEDKVRENNLFYNYFFDFSTDQYSKKKL